MFQVKTNADGIVDTYKLIGRVQRRAPIIMAIALSKTAKQTREREEREMGRVFKNPRKYVLNSLFSRTASRDNLTASVEDRYFAGKGTPASNFLTPQIKGGGRGKKRSEKILERAGILPADRYMLPSNQAPAKVRQNQGNQYRAMLAGLGAFQGDAASQNAKKGSSGDDYFVMYEKDRTDPIGIAKRNKGGKRFRMYFVFIKRPNYKKLFKFYEIGERFGERMLKVNIIRTIKSTFK